MERVHDMQCQLTIVLSPWGNIAVILENKSHFFSCFRTVRGRTRNCVGNTILKDNFSHN